MPHSLIPAFLRRLWVLMAKLETSLLEIREFRLMAGCRFARYGDKKSPVPVFFRAFRAGGFYSFTQGLRPG